MAVAFSHGDDKREWVIENVAGSQVHALMEFVPKGESLAAWNEMVANQIAFTSANVSEFVDVWVGGLEKSAPSARLSRESSSTDSITIRYEALDANEMGIRRFIQGPDGIYMLAYHVRPSVRRDDIYDAWARNIANARLVPNPARQP